MMLVNAYQFAGPPASSAFYDAVMALSPASYLRFGETSGTTAADSSGNGRSASIAVNASGLTTPGLISGDSNAAFLMPSALTPISMASAPVDTGGSWTFGCVIRPDILPPQDGVGVVLQVGSNGNSCPEMSIQSSGSGFFIRIMRSGSSQLFRSTSTFVYGSKLVVFLRQTATTITLTVNGVAEGSSTNRWGTFAGLTRLGYGRFSADAYPFVGAMDEFCFFPSALTDPQISALTAAAG